MKQQYIDKIREACIKANPEIMEFKKGLAPISGGYFQRPIQLADVLIMMAEENFSFMILPISKVFIIEKGGNSYYKKAIKWDLTKPLEDQSEETLKFISELLK